MSHTLSARTLLFRSARIYCSIRAKCSGDGLYRGPLSEVLVRRDQFSSHCLNHSMMPIGLKNVRPLATSTKKVEQFILPDIGEGINEVVIKEWLVKIGDKVKEFDGICDVESDKATATISSRYEGVVTKVHYEVGAMAKVGKPLVDIQVDSVSEQEEACNKDEVPSQETRDTDNSKPRDTQESRIQTLPAVRRLAKENGVDLSKVNATGKHGNILKEDVLAYIEESRPSASEKLPTSQILNNQPTSTTFETTTVPFNGIQRAMFKTMTQSLKIPHFALRNDIDMSSLVEASRRHNSRKESENKVSNLAYIIKMVSLALREYPQLNASISNEENGLVIKPYHNVGVAVDTPSGLMVPNIKNVQDLSITDINSELLRLRKLAYASRLGPAELSGGTITLSNIGAIGGVVGVPVIVAPEILIGALGEIRKLARYNEQGQLVPRQILQLTWSADHRVVDGATLSRFTNLLKQLLEEPNLALLRMC